MPSFRYQEDRECQRAEGNQNGGQIGSERERSQQIAHRSIFLGSDNEYADDGKDNDADSSNQQPQPCNCVVMSPEAEKAEAPKAAVARIDPQ